MQVSYHESNEDARVTIGLRGGNLKALRTSKGVRVTIEKFEGDECDRVAAAITFCVSCEDYERLICELSRLECGFSACEPCGLFDQDDERGEHDECDDEPRTVRVRVGDIRKATRGLPADDTIELTLGESGTA